MAAVLRARGELDEAARSLDAAEPLYQPGFFPEVEPIPAQLARVRIDQGRLLDAREWARRNDVSLDRAPDFRGEYDALTLVRLVLAEHRAEDALAPITAVEDVEAQLDRIVAAAGTVGRVGSLVEAHLLRALADQVRGDLDSALDQLRVALLLGAPAGYRRRFLDEGAPMQTLLLAVAERPDWAEAAMARDVLRAAEQETTSVASTASATRPDLVLPAEALSEREREVLRLLATDLTGPDIARRLYVSVNTLRTHTKHIFTKLDVNTRRAAVRRAGELGLL
jgi:LuxR family maltose regulon positive regulatory protein